MWLTPRRRGRRMSSTKEEDVLRAENVLREEASIQNSRREVRILVIRKFEN